MGIVMTQISCMGKRSCCSAGIFCRDASWVLDTCQEVDEVLKVLHDCRTQRHTAQGDCLVLNDLAAALRVPERRMWDCIAVNPSQYPLLRTRHIFRFPICRSFSQVPVLLLFVSVVPQGSNTSV